MRIKTKLYLGLGALFAMIVGLSLLSALSINRLNEQTEQILVANYNTVEYSRQMMLALDADLARFQKPLAAQQANVTEPGEQELTHLLTTHYKQLQASNDAGLKALIRQDLSAIMQLNMQAIEHKTQLARQTAQNANLNIAILGTFCFLVAFTLLLNLPANIADPIKKLNESIAAIARRNYSQRVVITDKSEFAQLAESINAMAEKLEEYNDSNVQKLTQEKRRLDTLINNLSDPVIGLNEQGQVLFANEAALSILGLQKEALIGRKATEVAGQNDLLKALLAAGLQEQSGKNASPGNMPLKIYAGNKESYFTQTMVPIDIVPPGETRPQHLGDVILLQNITPYKELEFAKTHFIATVSHELKTPIASIQMSTRLLQDKRIGVLNEEQTELIANVADDTGRLLKITGELLNMAQVETGNLQLKPAAVAPAQLIEYAVSANHAAAEEKHIKLLVASLANLPPVYADADKTGWVLTNLLSNAIRYSYEHAEVSIACTLHQNELEITVADGGQGIAPEHLSRIFDRYYRIPGSRKEGTGLGLSISRDIMEAQGGSIHVQSEYGAGSTFSICLPLFS